MSRLIDWNTVTPDEVTIEDLKNSVEMDFPQTYSGQAWRGVWKMYHVEYVHNPQAFLKKTGWSHFDYLYGMGLTGFMVGWALNALRKILGFGPVADGATVVIGGSEAEQPVGVPQGTAEQSLKKVLGGTNDQAQNN